jgi:hypothetical protein
MTENNMPARLDIEALVQQQVDELRVAGKLYTFNPETRCRVCQSQDSLDLVNTLLSHGLTYAAIMKCLVPVNAVRRKNNQITKASLYWHQKNHFNTQEPARAIYRQIMEDRAREHEVNFIEGTSTAVTAMSYLETMMVKGYKKLTDDNFDNVSIVEGMTAAIKLNELTRKEAGLAEAAKAMNEMNRIIAAVKEVVPERYFNQILARLDSGGENVIDVESIESVIQRQEEENEEDAFDPDVDDNEEEENW